jgi:hypothetical protein
VAIRRGIPKVDDMPEALVADASVGALDIVYPPDPQPTLICAMLK